MVPPASFKAGAGTAIVFDGSVVMLQVRLVHYVLCQAVTLQGAGIFLAVAARGGGWGVAS